jgi:hypothetical protein
MQVIHYDSNIFARVAFHHCVKCQPGSTAVSRRRQTIRREPRGAARGSQFV